MYLTPARFREMGFGIDISELDDAELAALIAQATSVVDAYCNVPRIPQKHDFRGGVIKKEQHSWAMPEHSMDYGQRRMYPFHWPILQITDFKIYVTNSQYVEIAPSELFINNSERWFEIVSYAVTSIGMFGALIVPNIGLATPVAKVGYTYGWSLYSADEYLIAGDGQTWRSQNQFWHSTDDVEGDARTPVIRKNGVVESSGFTIDYTEGTIVFDDNLSATDTVSADYYYKLPNELQYGTGHIVAHLHGQAELHARGMAHLTQLKVAEVEMRRDTPGGKSLSENLDILIPEAALLLSGFKADNMTVR
jgi:hypothetical protein